MKYLIAEKFKSLQGEGVYAGTPMAFIRFVGCSVGKSVCSACDTDFEQPVVWRGGGEFEPEELAEWSLPYEHVCLTGGEPMDQDLRDLFDALNHRVIDPRTWSEPVMVHIETSGTKAIGLIPMEIVPTWICVSPKPGFIEDVLVKQANEVKVIMPGLGVLKHGNVLAPSSTFSMTSHVPVPDVYRNNQEEAGRRWPDLNDALRWADQGKIVFLQPRNEKNEINQQNLRLCMDIIAEHPQLRLSMQLHKLLKVQ